jgi:hypothetical protein
VTTFGCARMKVLWPRYCEINHANASIAATLYIIIQRKCENLAVANFCELHPVEMQTFTLVGPACYLTATVTAPVQLHAHPLKTTHTIKLQRTFVALILKVFYLSAAVQSSVVTSHSVDLIGVHCTIVARVLMWCVEV